MENRKEQTNQTKRKSVSSEVMIDVLLEVTQKQQEIIESQMKQIDEATDLLKEILQRYEQ
jgi:predicted nucleic acid-binding protein